MSPVDDISHLVVDNGCGGPAVLKVDRNMDSHLLQLFSILSVISITHSVEFTRLQCKNIFIMSLDHSNYLEHNI